ncbi:MAG: 5'-3' exonuclease H3TH domain-containing protein [Opitutales bacterium]
MSTWLLLDGFNLAFRAFYGMPELTRADGFPTGALHGWVRTLWMLQDQEIAPPTAAFFDLGGSDRHTALHADYKAQRADMPEPLAKQLEPLKQLTRALGIPVIERSGTEADDLIASAATRLLAQGHDVLLVSADKDFAQLVRYDDHHYLLQLVPPPTANPKLGWRRLDPAAIREKFGVPPAQIPALLALTGDTSDNIPGLDGVGYKTAAKWLAEFPDLDTLLRRWDWVKPERFRPLLRDSADLLHRNLQLVTLRTDLDPGPLDSVPPNPAALFALLEEYDMKRTLAEARQRFPSS